MPPKNVRINNMLLAIIPNKKKKREKNNDMREM